MAAEGLEMEEEESARLEAERLVRARLAEEEVAERLETE